MWWRVLYQVSKQCSKLFPKSTSTYKKFNPKLQSENSSLKIEVKNSKSTPVKKWVNCELQITIFTENGWDTEANVMKNVLLKFKSNPALLKL